MATTRTRQTQDSRYKSKVAQCDLLDLVGYNLKRAYMCFHDDLVRVLAQFDLKQRTFSVLSLVVENPDINQSKIAETLGIERSGTVVIIDDLEGRALVHRTRVKSDRRAYALRVTPKGWALYRAAISEVIDHENRMLASFTGDEKKSLIGLLHRLHGLDSKEN